MQSDPSELAPPAPGTQVLRRAHDILRLLARQARDGMRVIDIASELGLEQPTAHRLLRGLVQERMASHDIKSKRYFLGPALHELGLSASRRFPLREVMQPSIERLAQATGDTVVITVQSGLDGVCVERRTGEFPIRTATVTVGTRRPLAAGAGGMAILSTMPAEHRQRIIHANAERLQRDEAELLALVDDAERTGSALNTYRHTAPPIAAIGVPVLGSFGECVAGLAVVALSMRLSGKRRVEVTRLLHAEAVAIRHEFERASLPAE